MTFKVATWNMNHWQRSRLSEEAWQFLDSLGADISMVQEAVSPPYPSNYVGQTINDKGRNWGSGIVSRNLALTPITHARSRHNSSKKDEEYLHRTWPGILSIVKADLPDNTQLTAISCYGLIDNGYAQTTMHRVIADLIPLFDSRLGKQVILAGDINIGTQQSDMTARYRHQAILEGIKSLGLVDCFEVTKAHRPPATDCPCIEAPDCRHVTTHIHNTGSHTQNDYIFVTKNLSRKLKKCYALSEPDRFPVNEDGKWKLSDHCPVIAEFDL